MRSFQPAVFAVMLCADMLSPVESLYVHVPFCVKKCAYCAFYSEPGDEAQRDRFVAALIREMEMVAESLRPKTVFFGGGTPSILSVRQWQTLLEAMERLHLLGAAEFTIESNPATLSLDKARLLKSYGVNRISMGVQSFDPAMLARLGRVHNREMVFESFDLLCRAGFDNIGIDLMFAIPGQTMETWRGTLREALALKCEHLSCYELIYEEDTPFFEMLQTGKSQENEDLACDMYEELLAAVDAGGYAQYEISNFARRTPGETGEVPLRACQHNVNYWRAGDFHGIGPSATGYVGGTRTKNRADTAAYCAELEAGRRPVESSETLSPEARAGETAAFGLRMNAGWPLDLFLRRTGFDLAKHWTKEIDQLVRLEYAERDSTRFRLTRKGLRYADWAAELFLRPD